MVNIASVTVPNWQGNATGITLRVYTNASFTAADGTICPQTIRTNACNGLGTFFASFPCSVASGALTIPLVALPSTTDSPDNPSATYSAVIFDTASNQVLEAFGTTANFALAPGDTTWAAIFATGANQ